MQRATYQVNTALTLELYAAFSVIDQLRFIKIYKDLLLYKFATNDSDVFS